MLIENTNEDEQYKNGFTCGYEWLSFGRWNFLHPSATYTYPSGHKLHGYIPGGPCFFSRYETYDPKYKAEAIKIDVCRRAWRNGWIDGINAYVLLHNLDYPQVEK